MSEFFGLSRHHCDTAGVGLSDHDWHKANPRFSGENFEGNRRLVEEVKAVAAEAGATPALVAIAMADMQPVQLPFNWPRVDRSRAGSGRGLRPHHSIGEDDNGHLR